MSNKLIQDVLENVGRYMILFAIIITIISLLYYYILKVFNLLLIYIMKV